MKPTQFLLLTVPVACLWSCATEPERPEEAAAVNPAPAAESEDSDDVIPALFPPAHRSVTLKATDPGGLTLSDVLEQAKGGTGVAFTVDERSRMMLEQTRWKLGGDLEIPAEKFWPVLESMLALNGFMLVPVHREEPYIVTLISVENSVHNDLKAFALEVQASELEHYAKHPAVLVSTVVDVRPLDARQVSTSMRQMFPDARVTSIIPFGESGQLLVTGFAPNVANLARQLRQVAEMERTPRPEGDPAEAASTERTAAALVIEPASSPGGFKPVFPPAKHGFTLKATDKDGPSLEEVLAQTQAATGVGILVDEMTRQMLRQSRPLLSSELEVPAETVWPVVESLLIRSGFMLATIHRGEPQLVAVISLQGSGRFDLRSLTVEVPASELDHYADHPAVLVSTILDVRPLDARMLATTLRQMLPDARTSSILPPTGSQLMLAGFAPDVVAMVRQLREMAAIEQKRLSEAASTKDAKAEPVTPR